ncbi:MAG TPA: trehalase family glycosidase, partial [Acidisarcina sp.]
MNRPIITHKIKTGLLVSLLALIFTVSFPSTSAQQNTQRADILTYIHSGWDTLSRSMTECKSVADLKVATAPILYLPAGMETPPSVAAMQQQCSLQVAHLPRPIHHMGDVRVSEIPKEGLLYLPNPYVVPGGRFNEMYGWDSYFIVLGLVKDGHAPLAKGMVENFFFEIENYGAVLNANRTYFFTRSQPPLLSSMIREVYEASSSNPTPDQNAWLKRAYTYAKRDHALWTSAPHQAGTTGLARYIDIGAGPVPEMADDSTYYPDVIRWLLAHPDVSTDYLIESSASPTAAETKALAERSCDIESSKVCASAIVDGRRLSRDFYSGDRAMRESGFDTSFRFGPFSGSTEEFAPVCLNSLLYKYEQDLAHFATILGLPAEAAHWNQVAAARKAAINRYLWHPAASHKSAMPDESGSQGSQAGGMFYDYNYVHGRPSSYNFITAFYPLWAGLATTQQAASMDADLKLFEHEGGLAMSDN